MYEGYGPHGIAILIETATDNIKPDRCQHPGLFLPGGRRLGKTGSLDFIFTRKGIFRLPAEGLNLEELELELIDFGAEDIYEHEGEIIIETVFYRFWRRCRKLWKKKVYR